MFGEKPPPRITIGTPLILKARAPFGAPGDVPLVRYEVTFLIPNSSLVEFRAGPPCDTELRSV